MGGNFVFSSEVFEDCILTPTQLADLEFTPLVAEDLGRNKEAMKLFQSKVNGVEV